NGLSSPHPPKKKLSDTSAGMPLTVTLGLLLLAKNAFVLTLITPATATWVASGNGAAIANSSPTMNPLVGDVTVRTGLSVVLRSTSTLAPPRPGAFWAITVTVLLPSASATAAV